MTCTPFFMYNTTGWKFGEFKTDPIENVPGVSFIKFNADFKVYDWRDFFGEGKLYEHVPLIGSLLAEKKRCLFSFLGDENEKQRCKDEVTQPIMAVLADGSEKTLPNEVSPSCSKYFTSEKLEAARDGCTALKIASVSTRKNRCTQTGFTLLTIYPKSMKH